MRRYIVHAVVFGSIFGILEACTEEEKPATLTLPDGAAPDGVAPSTDGANSLDSANADVRTSPADAATDADADAATTVDADADADGAGADASADATVGDADAAVDADATADVYDGGSCVAVIDGGAQCNSLTNIGADVALVITGTAIPVGTGGPIANGRYVLTALAAYNGSAAVAGSLKQTLEICGNVAQLVGDELGKPQYNKTFLIGNDGLAILPPVCTTQVPNAELNATSYTATPSTLTLYSPSLLLSVTYTKQ